MTWLIDCYNVLHTPMPPMLAGLDEAGLCRTLARTPLARGTVVVVADGAPKPLGVVESPVPTVDLVYSGPSRSADDVIIERIRSHSAPRRLTAVSSDREIRRAAAARRCRVVTSEQFINLLCERLRGAGSSPFGSRPDVGTLSAEHVEGWMEEMGLADGTGPNGSALPAEADPLDGLDWDALEALERGDAPDPDKPDPPLAT